MKRHFLKTINLSSFELQLLGLLYDFRKIDTTTLKTLTAPDMSRFKFHAWLRDLETRGLILQERKPGSPSIIGLRKAGATAIGRPIKSQHYEAVGKRTLHIHQLQMKVEAIASRLNLVIHREAPPTPGDKATIRVTETRQLVIEDFLFWERERISKLEQSGRYVDPSQRRDLEAGITPVPASFRDYYVHQEDFTGAVLIVTRPSADRSFWLAKRNDFREMAQRIPQLPVIAVFNEQLPPPGLKAELDKAGLITVTLTGLSGKLVEKLNLVVDEKVG